MKRAILLALLALTAPVRAAEDAPLETVTVTGEKLAPQIIIHNFITSYAVPTLMLGAIARWQYPICPMTQGLTAQFNEMVTKRVREIAGQVGAPVNAAAGCAPNIYMTFTSQPQEMVNAALAKNPYILGGALDHSVSHAVQAWYGTAIVDARGVETSDTEYAGMTAMPSSHFGIMPMGGVSGVPTSAKSGSLLRGGESSAISSAFIVVDLGKVSTVPLNSIADYMAMLALSQTGSYDVCRPLPSIASLLAQGCNAANQSAAISPSDLAYLRGVYKMDAGATLQVQMNDIAAEMEAAAP